MLKDIFSQSILFLPILCQVDLIRHVVTGVNHLIQTEELLANHQHIDSFIAKIVKRTQNTKNERNDWLSLRSISFSLTSLGKLELYTGWLLLAVTINPLDKTRGISLQSVDTVWYYINQQISFKLWKELTLTNNTQTAVTNMTKNRKVGKQNYLTWRFVCFDIHLQKWPFIIRVTTKFKFKISN